MAETSPVPTTDLFRLDGRVAVVTGASSGLGERFARVLHAAGATVVVGARRRDRLEALAESCGDRIVPVGCDVTDDDDRRDLIATALQAGGGHLDVLVNNAGVGESQAAEREPLDHFDRVVDVNLRSVFRLAQLAAEPMLARGSGSIVNVASILGLVGSSPMKLASYCASKGGVVNLTRQLGCEWGRKGVRVNAVAPGWFPTEMNEGDWDDPAFVGFVRNNTPMGRGGEMHELDGALLFLASDASTFVTGQTVAVDGGWTAR